MPVERKLAEAKWNLYCICSHTFANCSIFTASVAGKISHCSDIAPVCMSITHNLLSPADHHHVHSIHHELLKDLIPQHSDDHNKHNHQCQYCTVYGDLVLPFKLGIDQVLDWIQVRLNFYQSFFRHVYFNLQKLYLLPQGRAPPLTF